MSTTSRPKRSLFNKPSWAAKTTIEVTENPVPVFGQNVVYEEIVAAEKKRREKHAQRAKERAEREKEKAEKLKRQTVKVGDAKRRRISNEDLDEDHDSGKESGNESDARSVRSAKSVSDRSDRSRSRSRTSSPPKQRPILRSTLQKDKVEGLVSGLDSSKSSRIKSQARSTTIILDDDEEGDVSRQQDSGADDSSHPMSRRKQAPKPTEPEPESEEEDEYLRELKQKAREEARIQRFRPVAGKEGTPDTNSRVASQDPRSPSQAREDSLNPQLDSRQASAAPDTEDPKVEILIKTIIPNAREMIVTRHASQPLDKVKEFWCQRNNLNPAIVSKVFFTWNGTRLFNSTTMRSIITRLKKLHPMPDGSDPSMGKIEIEAVTEEIFEYRTKQRERRKREEMTGPSEYQDQEHDDSNDAETQANADSNGNPSTADPNGPEQEQEQPAEKTGIVIRLTNPAQDDMSLRLRPNTAIARIIHGYRKIKKIDPSKECWLVFDGERLEDTQTVEEVEFEHEDTVEVHIR